MLPFGWILINAFNLRVELFKYGFTLTWLLWDQLVVKSQSCVREPLSIHISKYIFMRAIQWDIGIRCKRKRSLIRH